MNVIGGALGRARAKAHRQPNNLLVSWVGAYSFRKLFCLARILADFEYGGVNGKFIKIFLAIAIARLPKNSRLQGRTKVEKFENFIENLKLF